MMCDLIEKEKTAIQRLKCFEPDNDSYHVCYSGGKDSDVLRILCQLANVRHELHYNLVTADAPETVQYIKSIGSVSIDKARYSDGRHKTIFNLIESKMMPPTRKHRFCCSELKECGGKGKLKVIGVRWSESLSRSENGALLKIIGKPKTVKKYLESNIIDYDVTKQGGVVMNYDNSELRRVTEYCYRTTSTMISPIIDWSNDDVWQFLHYYGCRSNPLYQCGFSRVGCIGCPKAGSKTMKYEFSLYPKFRSNYIRAFDRMLKVRIANNKPTSWNSGLDVYRWWVGDNPDQLCFDGFDVSEL